MAIDRDLIEDAIFGWRGSQRFTQDSPVLPDVWIEYARNPGQAVGLLLEPSGGTSPASIYKALADKFEASGRRRARLAQNRTTVAVDLRLAQLIEIVLPLTQWWAEADRKGLKGNGPWLVFPALSLYGSSQNQPAADDLSVAEEFMADLVALVDARDATFYAPAIVHLIHIVGLVACAEADPERMERLEKAYKHDGSRDFFAHNLTAVVAAVRVGWNYLNNHIEPPVLNSGAALLWTINRNRSATISLASSVLSVKGDAARRLFEIDASRITWAIVDSGVDARHPAFLDLSDQSNDGFAKRYRAGDVTYTEILAKSRIVETYDFSFIRDFLVNPEGAPSHYRLADNFEWRAKDLRDRLREGRDIDWQPLVPILQIQHDENYFPPQNAHGTHVAGILGSNLCETDNPRGGVLKGMCPDIRLIDIRVFDRNGQSEEFALLSALQFLRYLNSRREYIVVHGANFSFSLRHDVANFACGRTPICHEANRLVDSGIVVVAAAGNNGYMKLQTTRGEVHEAYNGVSITDPGNAEGVITVGSTHRAEPHNYGVSYFSSRGPTGDGRYKPDLVAPGEKILSCVTNRGVQAMDGTSMAAPHVSGAAALLMARQREFIGQPRRIKEILCKTATDLGRERYFQGSGLLDVLRALQSI